MKTYVLLDVCENSLEGIRSVGNVEFRMAKVDEEVWKISLHTVIGTPQSPMSVVPSLCEFIGRAFLEKYSPLVVPEFQPQCELYFINVRKMSHE